MAILEQEVGLVIDLDILDTKPEADNWNLEKAVVVFELDVEKL